MNAINFDIQAGIIEFAILSTSVADLPGLFAQLLAISPPLRDYIRCKHSFWVRLATHFSPHQIRHAIRLYRECRRVPRWQLAFRSCDLGHSQWNLLMGLLHEARSLTILSQPRRSSLPAFVNDLSLVPHPPCPLRHLILTGFRVPLHNLFGALSAHPSLESLRVILPHIDSSTSFVCQLPELLVLHISGHPNDIHSFGSFLTHPKLQHTIIEPRGTIAHFTNSTAPNPLQLNDARIVSIRGNLCWMTVNRYLLRCSKVTHLHIELLESAHAHAFLTDLAVRLTQPQLPQLLQHVSISPIQSVTAVGHLLEIIQQNNPFLATLSLGVIDMIPSQEISPLCIFLTPSVIPGPLTFCDDIETGSGAGIRTILQWGQGKFPVIDGWAQRIRGGYDSDEDSYEWDS